MQKINNTQPISYNSLARLNYGGGEPQIVTKGVIWGGRNTEQENKEENYIPIISCHCAYLIHVSLLSAVKLMFRDNKWIFIYIVSAANRFWLKLQQLQFIRYLSSLRLPKCTSFCPQAATLKKEEAVLRYYLAKNKNKFICQ